MLLQGRVWKYGDNVNTDVIFPGKYTYTVTECSEIARHALEDLDPSFVANVQPGDIIVGGRNWGCGSSREQAATCLVYNGVAAVIAESFSRIFYRNALNNGLLVIGCPAAVQAIQPGETITVDLERNLIRCTAGEFVYPPLGIVQAGGLVEYVKRQTSRVTFDV
jgi:3-isopropylmalate/(R)-2-methylmalate dehydratase small subunit